MLELFLIASVWAADPVTQAVESYSKVASYSVTLVSRGRDATEVIKYFYKKPGFVRMEFIDPHKGAVLVYDPAKREVKLRPFESIGFFVMTLDPGNRLIRSSRGHTVDKSDIGSLLDNVRALERAGGARIEGFDRIGGRDTSIIVVEGDPPAPDGTSKYILWLDRNIFLPLKVRAYDNEGRLIEEVLMEDLEVDPELPEKFFTLE